MTRYVTQREMRNDSATIFRALENGEGFVLTRNGTPIAEVTPIRRRRFVSRAEMKAAFAHVGKIDLAQMRAEADEYIDPYPHDPWDRRDRD